jgi:hypothetical protein
MVEIFASFYPILDCLKKTHIFNLILNFQNLHLGELLRGDNDHESYSIYIVQ